MTATSGMIKFIVITLLLFGLGVIVLNLISYNRRQTNKLLQNRLKTYKPQMVIPTTVSSGIMPDFKLNTKPEKLTVKKNSTISIKKYSISLKDEKVPMIRN